MTLWLALKPCRGAVNRCSTSRTVIDKTGLNGSHDCELHWVPEDATRARALMYSGPSIFTAVMNPPKRQIGSTISIYAFVLVAAFVAMPPSLYPQTVGAEASASPVSYDVMSIRRDMTDSRNSSHAGTDDRYSSTNVSLKSVLAKIFNIKEDLIFGIPSLIESARFDIEAKIVSPDPEAIKKMTQEQHRMMLLPLLAERFQLKTHVETKTLPVYNLVVAKGGPKFVRSGDQAKQGGIGGRGDGKTLNYTFQAEPMSSLANLLTDRVHRTVIDNTGLAGYYDFTLSWGKNQGSTEQDDTGPAIFTALQEELGLKLEPAKGPVETLVVDHVEMPSEN